MTKRGDGAPEVHLFKTQETLSKTETNRSTMPQVTPNDLHDHKKWYHCCYHFQTGRTRVSPAYSSTFWNGLNYRDEHATRQLCRERSQIRGHCCN
jgi:hypothetical protein